MVKRCLLLLLWAIAAQAFALQGSGSVGFEENIKPLLDKRPTLARFIADQFHIVGDPMGTRIGNEAMPRMGGARIGPYFMWATYHSLQGDVPVILQINTKVHFMDTHGKEIKNGHLKKTASITEEVDSIEINPPDPGQPLK